VRENVAAIDLGTNTARLLIGFKDNDGSLRPLLVRRHITRLGGGFARESGISPNARERTIEAMIEFSRYLKDYRVARIRAVATSAVRDAVNGAQFVEGVFNKTGIRLEIIDGVEEALLTLHGVLSGLDDRKGDFFIFDVGGGSTEYTLADADRLLFTRSLPLGVVRLTEGKVRADAMEEKISRELSRLAGDIKEAELEKKISDAVLVGTAGTATTLAAIHLKMQDYDFLRVNNCCLSLTDIKGIYSDLAPLTPDERLGVIGLEKGREDLIVAGIMITVKTMEMFGFDRLKVSDYGLLEGVMLSVV
jgi:exopolyphosphatase/guanosine-5'-triphosphate,3'-diphosphate pyrophosphatase